MQTLSGLLNWIFWSLSNYIIIPSRPRAAPWSILFLQHSLPQLAQGGSLVSAALIYTWVNAVYTCGDLDSSFPIKRPSQPAQSSESHVCLEQRFPCWHPLQSAVGIPEHSAASILPTEFLMNCTGMWPGAQDSEISSMVEMCRQHREVLAWDSGLTRWFHFPLILRTTEQVSREKLII